MKAIGTQLFAASLGTRAHPTPSYERVSARDLQLRESWFRDAIFDNPELVIAPCREAGRVDEAEVWLPWAIEKNFGSGPIDVLLVSSYGRIGLVETKLSYNPQKRREVVAQLLDYALSLQDRGRAALPELPPGDDAPDEEDVVDAVAGGKFLLLIAGDALDPRALRLSEALLARHLTNEWDLFMIDVNLFHRQDGGDQVLLVPELLGLVRADIRQVVRVQVEGESPKAKVTVSRIGQDVAVARGRKLDSPDAFLAQVEATAPGVLDIARTLSDEFRRCAAAASGRVHLDLETRTLNLYAVSENGKKRRFLSLWPQGRLVVVFRYLSAAGEQVLVEQLKQLCRSVVGVEPGEKRLELQLADHPVEALSVLIDRLCAAIAAESAEPKQAT